MHALKGTENHFSRLEDTGISRPEDIADAFAFFNRTQTKKQGYTYIADYLRSERERTQPKSSNRENTTERKDKG